MRAAIPSSMLMLLVACGPVLEGNGPHSLAPQPSGVLRGTVVYVGPRPACEYDDSGEAQRLVGRVILTLFDYDNPPPPSGNATSALNLLVVPAEDLFMGLSDCMPQEPGAGDLTQPVTRSAPFVWPEIPLGDGASADYQIRGFFDYDEDFNPFFSVRNQPTRGDVIGGALVSATDPVPQMLRVRFGSMQENPDGQAVSGIVVTLGAPVNTEPPICSLSATPLSSETALALSQDPMQILAQMPTVGLALADMTPEGAYATALERAGVAFNSDPLGYAWYVRGVDADGDGAVDPHPVLGDFGLPWQTPVVILQRARTAAERVAGIPDVLIIGAALDPAITRGPEVLSPAVAVIVPPIALVDLKPGDPGCRIPYFAPGNSPLSYQSRVAECQELPTGQYNVNVLQGLAAATPETGVDSTVSQTGRDLAGGMFAGQAWSIPNELGPADSDYDPYARDQLPADVLLAEQGPAGRYAVVDPEPSNDVRAGCSAAQPVPSRCCEAVADLCGLPLCDPIDGDLVIRRLDQLQKDGTPACVPFAMPASCCPGT